MYTYKICQLYIYSYKCIYILIHSLFNIRFFLLLPYSTQSVSHLINTPSVLLKYYNFISDYNYIYKSEGLVKHIEKRHPECIEYLSKLEEIIFFLTT